MNPNFARIPKEWAHQPTIRTKTSLLNYRKKQLTKEAEKNLNKDRFTQSQGFYNSSYKQEDSVSYEIETRESLSTLKAYRKERNNSEAKDFLVTNLNEFKAFVTVSHPSVDKPLTVFEENRNKSRTELIENRKSNNTQEALRTFNKNALNAEKRLILRESTSLYSEAADGRVPYKSIQAERKRRDVDHLARYFSNPSIGIHKVELPKFSENLEFINMNESFQNHSLTPPRREHKQPQHPSKSLTKAPTEAQPKLSHYLINKQFHKKDTNKLHFLGSSYSLAKCPQVQTTLTSILNSVGSSQTFEEHEESAVPRSSIAQILSNAKLRIRTCGFPLL